jgi:hypothetical protein
MSADYEHPNTNPPLTPRRLPAPPKETRRISRPLPKVPRALACKQCGTSITSHSALLPESAVSRLSDVCPPFTSPNLSLRYLQIHDHFEGSWAKHYCSQICEFYDMTNAAERWWLILISGQIQRCSFKTCSTTYGDRRSYYARNHLCNVHDLPRLEDSSRP